MAITVRWSAARTRAKSGTVRDIKTSKTGHVTITVVQKGGDRFKTLAKNVVVRRGRRA
jgi:ribosomal protein S4E